MTTSRPREEAGSHSRRSQRLLDPLQGDVSVTAHIAADDLERLLDPRHYLGEAERLVARGFAARRSQGA